MNLAILIGNSAYESQSELPGCVNDITLMEKIVASTGKFQEILTISNSRSIELKEKLSKKINSLSNSTIDELFFYYTGHGLFRDGQFFFIPADYSETKHNTTSFANNELDTLLKSLKPELTVKIIDACESTQNYIKMMAEEKEKYVSATKSNFKSCYFMFSSLSDQYSYQDKLLSSFTRAITSALLEHDSASIRYADIIAHVADAFSDNKLQTPFFVNQASFTEVFTDQLPAVKETIRSNSFGILPGSAQIAPDTSMTPTAGQRKKILDLISADAAKCVPKDSAVKLIQEITKDVAESNVVAQAKEIFDLSTESLKSTGNITGIRNVFDEIQALKKEFFIEMAEEEESYTTEIEVPKKRNPNAAFYFSAMDIFNNYVETETRTVTRKRMRVVGFDSSAGLPSTGFTIKLTPKFPNLNLYTLNTFFVFNKKQFIIYSNKVEFFERDWKTWIVKEVGKWQRRELVFADGAAICKYFKDSIKDFQEEVLQVVEQRFVTDVQEKKEEKGKK